MIAPQTDPASSGSLRTGLAGSPTQRIADPRVTRTLATRAEPLARSAIDVALLAVLDALTAVTAQSTANIRARHGSTGDDERAPTVWAADRSDPFIARLLAVDNRVGGSQADVTLEISPGGNPGQEVLVRLSREPTGLFLRWTGDTRRDAAGEFTSIVETARSVLDYLAAPESPARWTGPIPAELTSHPSRPGASAQHRHRVDHPGAGHLRRLWDARVDQEAAAAERILADWFELAGLTEDGIRVDLWLEQTAIAGQFRPLVTSWLDWLRARGVLAADRQRIRRGPTLDRVLSSPRRSPSWDPPVAELAAVLTDRHEMIATVLTGDAEQQSLLEIEQLRPSRLMAAEPQLEPVWQQIADLVAECGRGSAPPLVADLGGTTVDNARLRAHLDAVGVAPTTVPLGTTTPVGRYDIVLAVGVLHRWADPVEAVRATVSLLRTEGVLIAVENTRLAPLAMLVAGLLEGGFTDAGGRPISTPTQDASAWLRLLDGAGFAATGTPVGPTPAVLLHGRRAVDVRPTSGPGDTDDRLGRAAPEQQDHPAPDRAAPIRPGTETEIARIWGELLSAAPRSRTDSFFELGGDSLRATRFIAAVRQRYGTTIAMRELFAGPQLFAVAARVDAALASSNADLDQDDLEQGVL